MANSGRNSVIFSLILKILTFIRRPKEADGTDRYLDSLRNLFHGSLVFPDPLFRHYGRCSA